MATGTETNTTETQGQQTCPSPGTFCWNELLTADTSAAAKFYTSLLGWKAEPFPGGMPYTLFNSEGKQVAGMMACPDPEMPPQWLSYVTVENIDETTQKAESLGATILLAPKEIPSVGRIAIIQDPQGAPVGLFQPMGTEE